MYGTLLYLHEKPLKSYCQCNVHCYSTSKWYFKILVILIDKGDINISSPLPQSASGKKCTQIKMEKKACKLYQPSISPGKLPSSMAETMQGEREKQRGLRDQGGLQAVSIMLS